MRKQNLFVFKINFVLKDQCFVNNCSEIGYFSLETHDYQIYAF